MASTETMPAGRKMLFGHPIGLYTLFFTEMWERASYYGNRALLVLFLVDAIKNHRGGLGITTENATAIYGLYTGCVYLMTLVGGWVADRLLGQQRSVWYGGIFIALGNAILAIPVGGLPLVFAGLTVIILGTGLLKPNVSVIVGQLYPEGGVSRDSGFSIFYSGINLGAFLGPIFASYFGERYNWHYGFLVASIGMLLGLFQYRLMRPYLGGAGLTAYHSGDASRDAVVRRRGWQTVGGGLLALAVIAFLLDIGALRFDIVWLASAISVFIFALAVAYFAYVLKFGGLDATERKQVVVIFLLFLGAAVFWSGFEQAGSSLNIFAADYTRRTFFGFEIPAGWFQIINPWFIIILAPVFGHLWVVLARRNLNPSVPLKFGLGLVQLGLGFLVMVFAAKVAVTGDKALPTWLIFTYLLHTTAELCLSPVGLSAVTKLAPARYLSQMMGTWFLADSLGSVMAGLAAGRFNPQDLHEMPRLFLQIVYITVGAGILFFIFSKPMRKLIGNIQ